MRKLRQAKKHNSGQIVGERCYHSHPKLALGGGTILGASCRDPVQGYDVYVGLDWNMVYQNAPQYPWNEYVPPSVLEIEFRIKDGGVPENVGEFNRMLEWLQQRLQQGQSIHVGCIGGHGRTGLVLAALAQRVNGDAHAAEWVRKHHCKSAIETTAQVQFLAKHYGIQAVQPAFLATLSSSHSTYAVKSDFTQPSLYNWMGSNEIWGESIDVRGFDK